MGYVYDFDICSIFFFGLTMFFYLRQRRLRNLQDRIFTAMLISAMTAVVFDFLSSSMEEYAMLHPAWLLYAVNILFIVGMQTCLPMFFLYAVAAAGRYGKYIRGRILPLALPYAVTMALLFLSPFSDFGVFRIDAMHIYQRGATYMALYVNMSFYVLGGIAVLLRNGRRVERAKRNVILLFVAVLFAATILQVVLRRYLLTASATALALTSVFYVLQSPVDQLNPFTGAFSRNLLPSLLQDYAEWGRAYTLLLFSLRSFDAYTRLYGVVAGDELLKAYATELMARFPEDVVVYMDTSEFTVVHPGRLSRAEVACVYRETPGSIALGDRVVELDVRVAGLPCAPDGGTGADNADADYMFKEMRTTSSKEPLYGDEAYRRTAAAVIGLEAALEELLAGGAAELTLSPVLDGGGGTAMWEARFLLSEETADYVSYDRFLQAAGQQGHAAAYYQEVLRALADRRQWFGPACRLCLPVLSAAFLHEDAAADLSRLLAGEGFTPCQVLFSIGEAELASSLPALIETIRRMAELGFGFMVDDFAEGYTDLSLLISLPLTYARLHRDLVEKAGTDPRAAALLTGLVEVLADVGVSAVCPGVDTAETETAARLAGASMLQGQRMGTPVRLCSK